MATSTTTAKRLRYRQGRWGANTTTNYTVCHQERDEGCTNPTGPFLNVLLSFIAGHDPFKQMTVAAATAKHFRRR